MPCTELHSGFGGAGLSRPKSDLAALRSASPTAPAALRASDPATFAMSPIVGPSFRLDEKFLEQIVRTCVEEYGCQKGTAGGVLAKTCQPLSARCRSNRAAGSMFPRRRYQFMSSSYANSRCFALDNGSRWRMDVENDSSVATSRWAATVSDLLTDIDIGKWKFSSQKDATPVPSLVQHRPVCKVRLEI